jgi:hypothetical protein
MRKDNFIILINDKIIIDKIIYKFSTLSEYDRKLKCAGSTICKKCHEYMNSKYCIKVARYNGIIPRSLCKFALIYDKKLKWVKIMYGSDIFRPMKLYGRVDIDKYNEYIEEIGSIFMSRPSLSLFESSLVNSIYKYEIYPSIKRKNDKKFNNT